MEKSTLNVSRLMTDVRESSALRSRVYRCNPIEIGLPFACIAFTSCCTRANPRWVRSQCRKFRCSPQDPRVGRMGVRYISRGPSRWGRNCTRETWRRSPCPRGRLCVPECTCDAPAVRTRTPSSGVACKDMRRFYFCIANYASRKIDGTRLSLFCIGHVPKEREREKSITSKIFSAERVERCSFIRQPSAGIPNVLRIARSCSRWWVGRLVIVYCVDNRGGGVCPTGLPR